MKARKSVPIGRLGLVLTAILAAVVISAWGLITVSYADGAPTAPYNLDVGYVDFSFGGIVEADHTATRPESKLWWNDGYWWATLWNNTAGTFQIYRLDWGNQEWQETGVAIDSRTYARTDTLWDEAAGKLYISSYPQKDNPSRTSNTMNRGRLYRYSYDEALETYHLDPGFPVNINHDETNSLVIDKDAGGTLWTTYVSRDPQGGDNRYQVYVNASGASDDDWDQDGAVSLLSDVGLSEAQVLTDDLSTVVTVDSTVAVLWTNQLSGTLHYAEYNQGVPMDQPAAWDHEVFTVTGGIDDHLSVRTNSAGQLFAAIKTNAVQTDTTTPLISMIARDTSGNYSEHVYSVAQYQDTRPDLVLDEGNNQVYIFVSGKAGGSKICYKTAEITSPLANMSFAPGDCGVPFIEDAVIGRVDSVTSVKLPVNNTTGLVALAADDHNGDVYVHNVIGDNLPPVLTHRSPAPGQLDVPVDSAVSFTFSQEMDEASVVNSANFTLVSSAGPVAGGPVVYDSATRTAVFTPTTVLESSTIYTATVTNGMQSAAAVPLYETETWSFSTGTPFVSFEVANFSVVENEPSATVSVTLSSPASSMVTVDYATSSGGTATAGADYTAVATSTLTFNPGEFSKTFTVPILDDAADEPNETVNLTLGNAVNATLAEPSTAVLTIIDDEGDPTLQFQPTSINVNEGDGTATVSVSLVPSALGPVTVDYATSNGSATAGSDYDATSGTLTFNAGETSKTFTVPITDDNADEPNETVNLALTNPTGGAVLGMPGNTAELTIVDNDATPAVRFAQASYTVNESAGSVTVDVTLNRPSEYANVTVNYATGTGTATSGTDYTATSGTLTFAPGDTTESFTVSITNNALHEATEFVNLLLSSPNNLTLGTPSQVQLTIEDDDPQPNVSFAVGAMTVDEDAGTAEITVELSAVSGRTTSVDYATGGGTATPGVDYTATSGTLEITAGSTSETFTIPIASDSVQEGIETVIITLSNPAGATLGSPSTMTLGISDGGLLYLPIIFKP